MTPRFVLLRDGEQWAVGRVVATCDDVPIYSLVDERFEFITDATARIVVDRAELLMNTKETPMPIQTITCERCGLPIEQATAQDIEGYLYTGRCRACRVGLKPGLVGMIENILAGPTLERS